MKRYFYAILGMMMMFLAGAVYAWSIICIPIKTEFAMWSTASISTCFTICMIMFCLGGILNAWILNRYKLCLSIVLCIILYCSGVGIAVLCQGNIINLYIGFGVMIGLAMGITYNTVMGNIVLWFPECTGFISGILLMSIGLGSFSLGKIYQAAISSGYLQWRMLFIIYGVLILIIFLLEPYLFGAYQQEIQIWKQSVKL